MMFDTFGLLGIVDLVLATVTALLARALAALAIRHVCWRNVTFSALLQPHVPDRRRSRAFSAFDFILAGHAVAQPRRWRCGSVLP